MNDETTKEIEDLSTLACSTDEVVRKRALMAMLGRVVGRATMASTQSATPIGETFSEIREDRDALVSETERLAANLRQARQERDTHKVNAETLHQALMESRKSADAAWAELEKTRGECDRAQQLAESRRDAVQQVERERDHWHQKWEAAQSNSETLARDLAEARADLEQAKESAQRWKTVAEGRDDVCTRLREKLDVIDRERNEAAFRLEALKNSLQLETVIQCLGGVLNDMTRGGDFEKAEACQFHASACSRLRSLAGLLEKAGRVLTSEELAEADRAMYDARTYADALLWLERKGYLSVRLPPEE